MEAPAGDEISLGTIGPWPGKVMHANIMQSCIIIVDGLHRPPGRGPREALRSFGAAAVWARPGCCSSGPLRTTVCTRWRIPRRPPFKGGISPRPWRIVSRDSTRSRTPIGGPSCAACPGSAEAGDGGARTARMVVAMAGSSQRMMQGAVLDASAPLYGRAAELLEIKPLLPGYLSRAFGSLPPRRIAELHALWGGIPRYWELAQPFGDSLEEAVDGLVLDSSGPLHAEPDRLLMQESPSAASLRPILDQIGAGVHRMSEIAGRLGQPATSLSRPLSRLIELGLVKREIPFGEEEKSGKLALYRIGDPFFRLWFSVVAPHRSLFAAGPRETRLAVWRKLRPNLEAQAWEDLCRACVPFLHKTDSPLGAPGPWMPARRYWRRGEPEWDVVASSLDGEHLLLGEVKWLEKPADAGTLRAVAAELEANGAPAVVRRPKNIIRAVFVPQVRGSVRSLASAHAVDCRTVLSCLV